MIEVAPVRAYGAGGQEQSSVQGGYAPKVAQSQSDILTMVGQLVKLEDKEDDAETFKRRYNLRVKEIIGWAAALSGTRVRRSRRAALQADVEKCVRLIAEISRSAPSVKHPNVVVAPDGGGARLYRLEAGKGARLELLPAQYDAGVQRLITAQEEEEFQVAYHRLAADLFTVRSLAAKWHIYDTETRIRSTEVTNSLERLEEAIRRDERRLEEAEEGEGSDASASDDAADSCQDEEDA